jgi:uncharacterized protein YggE
MREGGMAAAVPVGAPSFAGYPVMQTGSGMSGIWVMGEGVIMMEPDLAILNIGVETMGKSVSEATQQAAKAMDAIVAALKARGLQDRDIQTTYFNIYPQYEYTEVIESGIRKGKQILVGYTVSNSASVKIRDLKNVGEIIDDVAVAGGDDTRINGISFTVEDPNPKMAALREVAVKDALAKAQQFATLTGVTLGKLEYISELGVSAPVIYKDISYRAEAAAMAFAPSTPISGGEQELRLSVQVVFGIQ